jgi:hypothetical protein
VRLALDQGKGGFVRENHLWLLWWRWRTFGKFLAMKLVARVGTGIAHLDSGLDDGMGGKVVVTENRRPILGHW